MGNKYYYLVSSLPSLAFGREPAVDTDSFIRECRKWLMDRDVKLLLEAKLQNTGVEKRYAGFLEEWRVFDINFRNAVAGAREMLKLSPDKRMPDEAREVFAQESPLDKEREFEKIRWDFLEEKEFDRHFDTNWLIVYYLKLQILERLAGFEYQKGQNRFRRLCEAGYGQKTR